MPRLNVQKDLIKRLKKELSIPAYIQVPQKRPKRFVVIERSGGRRTTILHDRVGIEVIVWAETEQAAFNLAEKISDLFFGLKFSEGYGVVEEESFYSDYDYSAKSPRWYLSYTLTTYVSNQNIN